jgi:hypothetical protein
MNAKSSVTATKSGSTGILRLPVFRPAMTI